MRTKGFGKIFAAMTLAMGVMPSLAHAYQGPTDQADPSVIEEEWRQEERSNPRPRSAVPVARPRAAAPAVESAIVVGAVRVEGAAALPPSAFAPAIEKYVGRTLTPQELATLATEVAEAARGAGFSLATAWIPVQRVTNGVLRVVIDEGRIDAVEIEGNGIAARPYLAALANGRPVRTVDLERQLMVAGDVPGVRLGKARLDRRGSRNILIVQATQDRVQTRAYLDNWGSSTVGPVRARLTVDFYGLAASDDQLTIGGVLTPLQPNEFGLIRASYTKPIGTAGTEVSFGGYFARSNPGAELADFDIGGESVEFELGVRHPFTRTRSGSLWGGLELRVRDASQTRDDVIVRDDRLATLTVNGFAVHQLRNGRVRARLALVQGVNAFGATEEGDPLASRRDASGVFSKVEVWGEFLQNFTRRLSLLLQAEGQAASRPLLSSEEMGLGGRSFGRAWDYREFSGDRGVAGSAELRFDLADLPKPVSGAQLYAYGDAGSVSNYRGGVGGGSLASAGGGLRLCIDRFEAALEIGVPLTDGSDAKADRDPRISFSIGARF